MGRARTTNTRDNRSALTENGKKKQKKKIIPDLNFHRLNECGRVHTVCTAPAEFHFSVYFVHLKANAIHLSHLAMANKQVDF